MFYFKKIISYFDYYEFGEKKKNCGHVRILVKDQEVTVEIQIKGLGIQESRMCDIQVSGQNQNRLGRFVLDKGTGYYNACFHRGNMDGSGLSAFDITGLHIQIDEERYCEANWNWGKVPETYKNSSVEKQSPENLRAKTEDEQKGAARERAGRDEIPRIGNMQKLQSVQKNMQQASLYAPQSVTYAPEDTTEAERPGTEGRVTAHRDGEATQSVSGRERVEGEQAKTEREHVERIRNERAEEKTDAIKRRKEITYVKVISPEREVKRTDMKEPMEESGSDETIPQIESAKYTESPQQAGTGGYWEPVQQAEKKEPIGPVRQTDKVYTESIRPVKKEVYTESPRPMEKEAYTESPRPVKKETYAEAVRPMKKETYTEAVRPMKKEAYAESPRPVKREEYTEAAYPVQREEYTEAAHPVQREEYTEAAPPMQREDYTEPIQQEVKLENTQEIQETEKTEYSKAAGSEKEAAPRAEVQSQAGFQSRQQRKKTAEYEAVLHKSQLEEKEKEINSWYQNETEEIPLQKMLYEDKWKQLCCQYPVCHPFGENEEYISIAPKDFVILRKEYQNLVSNSFLLHSFYNYHHVILGKTEDRNEEMFYIGVPGSYLEREKKVAVMFGFEGFALSERGNRARSMAGSRNGAIETGAFGYYMRKVEI